jgi:uncharacterized protein YeaO (DUF488 family)
MVEKKRSVFDSRDVDVDRIGPRGIAKGQGLVDAWMRELAPNVELLKGSGRSPSVGRHFVSGTPMRWVSTRRTLRACGNAFDVSV